MPILLNVLFLTVKGSDNRNVRIQDDVQLIDSSVKEYLSRNKPNELEREQETLRSSVINAVENTSQVSMPMTQKDSIPKNQNELSKNLMKDSYEGLLIATKKLNEALCETIKNLDAIKKKI